MSEGLWQECNGERYITPIKEIAWRMVETQDALSTRKLVDSFEEQDLLEALIDSTKPQITSELQEYHPLLATPFRYPPLKYGSRFGRNYEPSLWYGSLNINTAMAELAFYRFHFINAVQADLGIIENLLTSFAIQIHALKGVKLDKKPFTKYKELISSATTYEESQALGSTMRQANVQGFTYYSARDPQQGLNIALYSPDAFQSKKPDLSSFQSWHCITNKECVEFKSVGILKPKIISFSIDSFNINGQLPSPAI